MTDGQQLKHYIENQRHSKTKVASDLKMTRQNLYNLFESVNLTDETKKRFEDYFKKKIFVASNGAAHTPKELRTAEDEPDLRIAIRELSETTNRHSIIDDRNSRNIERLITLLEVKLGVHKVSENLREKQRRTNSEKQ